MQEYVVEVDQGLNQKQLAEHLSVNRTKIDEIAVKAGLEPLHGLYPWRRIFRQVHGTERSSLAAHLDTLRVRYGTALPHFSDLETELRAPLLTFEEVAYRLGKKPDTLAKAIRQGRDALPFPTLVLGTRIRRYRPLEVKLWIDHGIALDLPSFKPDFRTNKKVTAKDSEASASGSQKLANVSSGEAREGLIAANESTKNALFGAFSSSKRISVR
jgi:hypothetical protein